MLRIKRMGVSLLLALLVGLSGCDATVAAERVALVIGNSRYAERPLRNPPNDARAMTALLRQLGFTVTETTDLDLRGFRQQVNAFLDQSKGAELRLFYYSGHGVSYDGDNYLLPIGHGVTRKHELPDQAYSLKALLRGLKDQGGINLVLLDSCRDHPFGDKSIWDDSKGMKPIQPKQTGILIGYAADEGQTASDNWGGGNSLYTTYLLQHLGQSLELREALMQVQQKVYAESHNQQLPMNEDRVLGKVYLAGGSSESSPSSVTPPPPPTVDHDLIAWQSAEKCGTAACFRAYLRKHPQGQYAEMAQARLEPEAESLKPAPVAPVAMPVKPAVAQPVAFTVPDPVAVVNGKSISKAIFEQYAQQLKGRTKVDSPESSKALVDQLVMEELLLQEAIKQKFADDPQIKQQLQMMQNNLLASSVTRKMLADNTPSEEAIKKEYETAVAAMRGKEYKASHILVDSEDKARAIIKELKRGSSFAELAKTKSSDSSAANGGDLGWFSPSMMVPPFAEATAKLAKGKYTEQPVQTPFGWHVILLEDTRDATPPSMDELKPQIVQMLQSKVMNDYLEKLKSRAKIKVEEIQSVKFLPDPVAVVNGKSISKAMFSQYAQQLKERAKVDSPEGVKALVVQLVMEELLLQEAAKQKLADDSQIKQQLQMMQNNLLASSVVRKMLSENAPSEAAIKKEYDTAVAAMKGKEYKASHILVDSEDKARAIIKELKRGSSFAELAKTKSSDSSAANGGDLGWFSPSMMVPLFAEATAKLAKGKYTEQPVQTQFGWHVILLEDTRDATPPSMDALKPQIAQVLQSKVVNDYLENLKSRAKIEVKDF